MPSYKNAVSGTWYCAFYYTDWQGKRKKKKKEGFKTKRESQYWERRFLEQYASTPTISFSSLVDAYLAAAQVRLKPTTYDVKRRIVENRIQPFFSHMLVSGISRRTVNAFRTQLLAEGLKMSYVRTIQAQLSSIFNFAIENYNLVSNPVQTASKLHSAQTINNDYWTLDEFRLFARSLKSPEHIMAFYMLFWTGMRVGEMLALRWEDINFIDNTIIVNKTSTRIKGSDVVTTPKTTAGSRIVVLPDFIANMLRDYKRMAKYNGDILFGITRAALLKKIHAGAKKMGVKQIRLHDLRHSHASLLIDAGFSPVEVADRLGHANPAVTLKVYSHFYQSKRTALAKRLNKI